jgi:hypothetical protein
VIGHRQSGASSFDLLVAEFSSSGASLWKKVLGTSGFEHAGGISGTVDGGVMVSAATDAGRVNLALWIKLSQSGAVISAQTASTPDSAGLFY